MFAGELRWPAADCSTASERTKERKRSLMIAPCFPVSGIAESMRRGKLFVGGIWKRTGTLAEAPGQCTDCPAPGGRPHFRVTLPGRWVPHLVGNSPAVSLPARRGRLGWPDFARASQESVAD